MLLDCQLKHLQSLLVLHLLWTGQTSYGQSYILSNLLTGGIISGVFEGGTATPSPTSSRLLASYTRDCALIELRNYVRDWNQ